MYIFIISLDRSPDRRSIILSRLEELGLQAEIFPAIDGRTITRRECFYDGRRRRLFYGKDMIVGEIGCARSHIAVCEEIVRRGLDHALVLEDDAILTDHLPAALAMLERSADKWDIVRFLGQDKDVRRMRTINKLEDDLTLARIYGTPGGAYGYVLNRRAADRLARCGAITWMPIDTLHGQTWWHGLRVRALLPTPVLADYRVVSTIGDERFSKAKSLRGWEWLIFPLTRYGFKLFDAGAKQCTFWIGLARDRLARER